jgi:hypothetical protein
MRGRAAAAAALPGAFLGAHLAALLFFLNPDLGFSVPMLLRSFLTIAPLLAAATLLLQLPLVLRCPARMLRLVPWQVSGVFLATALLAAVHASYFAYFLPAGINARLIKAAFWLGLGALVAFYTALLHTLHRRPYGWRSRLGLVLLAAASLFVMAERREAFRPDAQGSPLPSRIEGEAPVRLLVVGVESATLDVVLPLAQQGQLPFFAELLREGAYGRLRTVSPLRREPLWLTLATGKYPYQHGIVGSRVTSAPFLGASAELRLVPLGLGSGPWSAFGASSRPFHRGDLRALTLWEILARLGRAPLVVGWPHSAPAERGRAMAVSEEFFAARPDPSQAVPPELGVQAALFRLGPREVDSGILEEFGPELRPLALESLKQDLWRESLAYFLLDATPGLQVLFLRLPGLLEVSRATFGAYSAHHLEGLSDPQAEQASRDLAAYYRHLDGYLAQLWLREREAALIAVVSAHGVSAPSWWGRLTGELGGAMPHAGRFDRESDGMLLLRGPGVRRGALLGEGAVVDVVPTLLYALGLPMARDLDGRVLTGAFEPELLTRRPLSFVPSYESLALPENGEPAP